MKFQPTTMIFIKVTILGANSVLKERNIDQKANLQKFKNHLMYLHMCYIMLWWDKIGLKVENSLFCNFFSDSKHFEIYFFLTGDAAYHRKISVPTLLVYGMKDPLVSLVEMCEMERTIPKAYLELIPLAGHMLMQDQSQDLNVMLKKFITRYFTNWISKVNLSLSFFTHHLLIWNIVRYCN